MSATATASPAATVPDDYAPWADRAFYVAAQLVKQLRAEKAYRQDSQRIKAAARAVEEVGGSGGYTLEAWQDRARKYLRQWEGK